METELTKEGLKILFNYGVLGVFCVTLLIALYLVVKRMWAKDKEHGNRIERFTDVMQQHATNEAQQTEIMRDLKTLLQHQLTRGN